MHLYRVTDFSGVEEPEVTKAKRFEYIAKSYIVSLDEIAAQDALEFVAAGDAASYAAAAVMARDVWGQRENWNDVQRKVFLHLDREAFMNAVKTKAGALINAAANAATRENMNAAHTLGLMTDEQIAGYRAGVQWTFAVQSRARELIVSGEIDYDNDELWPEVPPKALAVAKEF